MKKRHKKTIKDVLFAIAIFTGMALLVYLIVEYQDTVWSFNAIHT